MKQNLFTHEKGHGMVKEIAQFAEKVNIKNLVLWHTEDMSLEIRKIEYTKEAKKYFFRQYIC